MVYVLLVSYSIQIYLVPGEDLRERVARAVLRHQPEREALDAVVGVDAAVEQSVVAALLLIDQLPVGWSRVSVKFAGHVEAQGRQRDRWWSEFREVKVFVVDWAEWAA